jgi:hypothetical protein
MNDNSYINEALKRIKQVIGDGQKNKKVLTIGCSVGRIPM